MRGNVTVNGLGQARPAFNAWFGVMPGITPAPRRTAVRLTDFGCESYLL
jgi:shikimate dehydrogenase